METIASTKYTLCVMCCCSFPLTDNDHQNYESDHHQKEKHNLFDFCNLLKKCSPLEYNSSNEENEDLLKSKKLSVCAQCGDFVKTALELRSKAGEMEVTVLNLQLELLNKMRQLTSQMETFYQHVSNIEGVIKGSDESYLQYHLQNQQGMQEEQSSDDGSTAGVIKMRKTFLNAVQDLRAYNSSISRKLNPNDQISIDTGNMNMSFEFEDASDMVEIGHYEEVVKVEVDNDDLNYFLDETEEEESILPFDHEEDEDEEQLISMEEEQVREEVTRGSKRGRKVKMKVIVKNTPKVNVHMSRSGKRKFTFTDEDKLKLELMRAMSPYKKMVVRRAFKREKYNVTEDSSNEPIMRYDFKLDKLLVGAVQVWMHEKEQTLTCSECNLTGKTSAKGNIKEQCGLEKRLKEHIIGSHLGGYKCPLCDQVRTSRTMYLEHLRDVHRGIQVKKQRKLDSLPKPHKCTICNYSTNKPCDLRRHLKTHEKKDKRVVGNRNKNIVKQEVISDEDD